MTFTVSILIIFLSIFMLRQYIKSLPLHGAFNYILSVPIVFYIINYPVRALFLQSAEINSEFNFSQDEVLYALIYSFIFLILLYAAYNTNSARASFADTKQIESPHCDEYLNNLLFVVICVVFVFKIATGRLYGLYEDVSDLYAPFWVNFILMFDAIKWFCAPLALTLWFLKHKKIYLYQGISIFGLIIFESVATTSKSPIIGLLLLFLFYKSIKKEKVSRKLLFIIPVIIVFMITTYMVRFYGNVRGSFAFESLVSNYQIITQVPDIEDIALKSLGSVAQRFNLLDGLMMTIRNSGRINKDIYEIGGVAELLNFIPRFIWSDRPLINFNIFLTQHIWQYDKQISETPVGRIGESYFVIGYLGLLYAIFYGFLFAKIENFFMGNLSTIGLAYYFFILYYYIWSDAHVVFYAKTILWVSTTIFIIVKSRSDQLAYNSTD